MALRDTERWYNVEGSVLKYAKDQLVTAQGLTADLYEGARFDPTSVDSWVEVRVFPESPVKEWRSVGDGDAGEDARLFININVYTKTSAYADAENLDGGYLESTRITDLVGEKFRFKVTIPIYQLHPGGNPALQVGNIFIMEARTKYLGVRKDTEVKNGLHWRNVRAVGRYDRRIATS